MGTHLFGNAANENLTVSGDISGNLIAFGSGADDLVLTQLGSTGSVTNNLIGFWGW